MTLAASVAFLSLLLWNSGGDLLYILFVAPVVVLICIVLFIVSAIRGNRRLVLSTSLALVGFIAVSGVLLKNERALRPWLRWLLWSRRYKAQLFAQPGAAGGGLETYRCEVPTVRRLEKQWYAVEFYTDEDWNHCPVR
jgi:hypothetical protein